MYTGLWKLSWMDWMNSKICLWFLPWKKKLRKRRKRFLSSATAVWVESDASTIQPMPNQNRTNFVQETRIKTCCRTLHNVRKWPKMSYLNFAFSNNFCPIQNDLSGNTVCPKGSVFQKLAKWTIFGIFDSLLSTLNVNVARFARNIECDILSDFQTLCCTLFFPTKLFIEVDLKMSSAVSIF